MKEKFLDPKACGWDFLTQSVEIASTAQFLVLRVPSTGREPENSQLFSGDLRVGCSSVRQGSKLFNDSRLAN